MISSNIMKFIKKILCTLDDAIFSKRPKAVKTYIFLVLLLLGIGFFHWGYLFRMGDISYKSHDWTKQYKYYTVLKEYVTTGNVPYHISEKFQTTDRFMGNPEIDFSPQILLLKFISVQDYFVVNLFLFYIICFVGCWLFKTRFNLSFFSFAVLFVFFSFNGYITAHFVMGHYMWITCFFMPFYFYLLFDLFQGKNPTRTWILLALVMVLVYLNAAPHTYVWLLVFLILIAVFNFDKAKYVFYIMLANIFLLFFRIIPNALTYYDHLGTRVMGYFSFGNLIEAFTVVHDAAYRPTAGKYHWWEYDAYIDVLGLAIIAFFGVFLSISKKHKDKNVNFNFLYLPLIALFVLSLGHFYRLITTVPIPLLNSENVTTRFIIVLMAALFIISAVRIEQYLPKLKTALSKTLAFLGLTYLITSLFTHSYVWNVRNIDKLYADANIDLSIKIVERYDPLYKFLVDYSPVISVIALIVILWMFFKAKDPVKKSS